MLSIDIINNQPFGVSLLGAAVDCTLGEIKPAALDEIKLIPGLICSHRSLLSAFNSIGFTTSLSILHKIKASLSLSKRNIFCYNA